MRVPFWLGSLFSLTFVSCSSSQEAVLSREPSSTAAGLNQETYLGGSAEAEAAQFETMKTQIRDIIVRQTKTLRGQDTHQRGFHSKAHGCLKGTLALDSDRPSWTRHGIFGNETQGWKLWARFSNGAGWREADINPDVRGLALKVIGVPGPKFMSDESMTQDFVMINNATGFGSDGKRFMDFAEVNAKSKGLKRLTELSAYAALNRDTHSAIMRGVTTTPLIKSVADIQYWGGTPYRLGPDQAIKYSVRPMECFRASVHSDCNSGKDIPEEAKDTGRFERELACRVQDRPNYAPKDENGLHIVREGFCMELVVQPQDLERPERTPIEDTSKEWKTPFTRVGIITFRNQVPSEHADLCEKMVFNPWHAIEAHRPLGHQNRARRVVYEASAVHRQGGVTEAALEW